MNHPTDAVLTRYATGGQGLDDVALWSIETHLDTCADCRARLTVGPETEAVLSRVATAMNDEIGTTAPARYRRHQAVQRRWFTFMLLPWLVMTLAVLACAVILDAAESSLPSLVLLVAPIAPLPGVAVAWSRKTDPAWELITTTPAAGLAMVLRRTLVVLVVVVPALLVAGAGDPLGLILLPSLAFTAAAIALGALVGVRRAAIALGSAWTLAVLFPSVLTESPSPLLRPDSTAVWALAVVVAAAVAARSGNHFRRLSSGN
ncbi:hypothetical protein [Cryptosporangium sp. NPDC051539]|uniref:hypothetical protein n=1 Tax=Cryptosporangium sp. NPDC051539 TaxID=3363962 RepID=UPI0037B8ABE8